MDWLIDKSALVGLAGSTDAAEWAVRIERGLVRITTVTLLETGYTARSGPGLRAGLRRPPLAAIPVAYQTPAVEDRAVEVLTLLADRGQHRAPSIPDLIIAAPAELAGLTVPHLDKDFEIIADVTGHPLERLHIGTGSPAGSRPVMTPTSETPLIPAPGRRRSAPRRKGAGKAPERGSGRQAGARHPAAVVRIAPNMR